MFHADAAEAYHLTSIQSSAHGAVLVKQSVCEVIRGNQKDPQHIQESISKR